LSNRLISASRNKAVLSDGVDISEMTLEWLLVPNLTGPNRGVHQIDSGTALLF